MGGEPRSTARVLVAERPGERAAGAAAGPVSALSARPTRLVRPRR
jgi:hypothetical protein